MPKMRLSRAFQVYASAAPADPPKWTLLTYEYVPDILEKRGPYREAHLAGAFKMVCHPQPMLVAHQSISVRDC
eukprot:scaffold239059_cov28-Prasinocladus_malaysianus.AAC.2